MGAINDAITQNKITFSKIEEIFEILITNNINAANNKEILYNIGLLKEYSYIKAKNASKEFIDISIKNKIVKHFISPLNTKNNFVEWTKIFFDINNDKLDSDSEFSQITENLKKKSLNKEFFQKNIKKYLFKSKLFNNLLTYGIPNNLREFIWDLSIEEKSGNNKYFNYEEEKKNYIYILKNVKYNSQIAKDINRTFINESEKTEKNLQKLNNLLHCINKYLDEYCQGVNFIVGFLLKFTNYNEVKTFYIIKNIISDIKGYFEDDFPLLKKNMNIFDLYFQELYPNLYNHFKKCEVYNEFWVGKWFQTLFTLSLSFNEVCIIWDILIIKGFDFIIYISLALISFFEKELLDLEDSSDILAYLKNALNPKLNPKEMISINKNQFEEGKYNIIPLNIVLDKANTIEKEINENDYLIKRTKSDNTLKKLNSFLSKDSNDNHNDFECLSTRESDNSIKHSLSSKLSVYSSKTENPKLLKNKALKNNVNNINNLKENLINTSLELKNNTISKKSTFSSKSLNTFNFNDNTNILKPRHSINTDVNNFSVNNLMNSYQINYPIMNGQYLYYNNNINYNIINNRPIYTNLLIYYP